MNFGSVCSGIEAASVAWKPLGWRCAFVSEIEPFPKRVLAHHYPDVPDLGDFTKIGAEHGPVDVLVGGTPCQSFSVAGLRAGLADPRGNLMLEFGALARRLRARWLVWENVPGVLSSNGGRDFGSFLGMLGQLGYGFAYRVLDAQYFGVAQRRRRVFVVGHAGGLWQRAAAVLFEPESLRGDPAPRRASREGVANALTERPGRGGGNSEGQRLIPELAHSVRGQAQMAHREDVDTLIAHTLRGSGFDASEDGTGRGTPLVTQEAFGGNRTSGALEVATACQAHGGPHGRQDFRSETFIVPFDTTQITHPANRSNPRPSDPCHPLVARNHPLAIAFHATQDPIHSSESFPCLGTGSGEGCGTLGVAYSISPGACGTPEGQDDIFINRSDVSRTLDQLCADPTRKQGGTMIHHAMSVRRLTPRECERLQGFPDDYTAIPGAKDGPRYRALGNSMAVPVMSWIGKRIQMVEDAVNRRSYGNE